MFSELGMALPPWVTDTWDNFTSVDDRTDRPKIETQPSLLSEINLFRSLTSWPTTDRFILHVLEGEVIILLMLAALL